MQRSTDRIVFVGPTDQASPWLLRALARCEAQFAALCESDADRAERAAAEHHARWPHHDLAAMLAETRPRAVVVAAPPAERAAVIRACLAGGASVLVVGAPPPQPAGRRAPRGRGIVWGAAPLRFAPAVELMLRLIESGKMAPLLSISLSETRCRTARLPEEAAWPLGRDPLFDLVDLLRAVAGPFREVFARGHPDGALHAVLVTRDDVPISLEARAHGRPDAESLRMELRGGEGSLLTLDGDMRLRCDVSGRTVASHAPGFARSDPTIEHGWLGWINEFLRRVRDPRGAAADDWQESVRTVEVLLAALSRAAAVPLDRARRASRGAIAT